MNPTNTKALYAAAPLLYRGRTLPVSASLMSYGFSCGDGRFELLREYSEKLEAHLRAQHEAGVPLDKLPAAVHVKDLDGVLRLFLSFYDEVSEAVVRELAYHSETVCDVCGAGNAYPVELGGRTRTLCNFHATRARNG